MDKVIQITREPANQQVRNGGADVTEKHLDAALYELQKLLFDAEALMATTAQALERQFGGDWRADMPNYPRSMRVAAKLVHDAYVRMEYAEIAGRADEIRSAQEAEPES